MKKFICLIIVLLLTVVTGCTTFSDAGIVNLEITKNNVEVEELEGDDMCVICVTTFRNVTPETIIKKREDYYCCL